MHGSDPWLQASADPEGPSARGGIVTIRSAILSHYAALAISLKLDVSAMLRKAGIDRACLVNPDIPIPHARAIALIEQSAVAAGSATLGIRMALARGTPDIGPLNLLLREEPDLRRALGSMQNYLHVHSRSMQVRLEEEGDIALLKTGLLLTDAAMPATQSTEMVVCGMMQTVKWLLGGPWSPNLVCFTHPAPAETRTHRALLGCPVEFGHDFNGFVLGRADMQRPLAHADPLLRRYAEDHVRALAARSSTDFAGMVSGLIGALLPSGRCSVVAVASHLSMDRSTLARRLARSGSSYAQLLQETRMKLAPRCCLEGWALTDIADHLGFADLAVFSRWFKSSFGHPPSRWRRERRIRPG